MLIKKAIANPIAESSALSACPLIWKSTLGNKEDIFGKISFSICALTWPESSASEREASTLTSFLPSIWLIFILPLLIE